MAVSIVQGYSISSFRDLGFYEPSNLVRTVVSVTDLAKFIVITIHTYGGVLSRGFGSTRFLGCVESRVTINVEVGTRGWLMGLF
jgi:hypothetical protein